MSQEPVRAESEIDVRCRFNTAERIQIIIVSIAVLLVLVTIVLTPVVASAQSYSAPDRGIYFGVSGGAARYFGSTDECDEIVDEINDAVAGEDDARVSQALATLVGGGDCQADDTGTAIRIFAGYQFSRWFSLEASITDLGDVRADLAGRTVVEGVRVDGDADIKLSIKGLGLDAVLNAPITPRFSIFGRVGVLAWDADATATARGTLSLGGQSLAIEDVTETASESGADVAIGAGLKFGLTEQVHLRAEFTHYEVVDTNVAWLGVEFRP